MINASYWALDDSDGHPDLMNLSLEDALSWAKEPDVIVFEAELCVPFPFIMPKVKIDMEELRRKLSAMDSRKLMVMPPEPKAPSGWERIKDVFRRSHNFL